ncbi:hypothetical protein A8H39_05355 [Paraburkholderia fungorum]|jgi:hypothetical protein|nr:hypothetical protein A8H39_05355 [Paraburkholderia fungorum]
MRAALLCNLVAGSSSSGQQHRQACERQSHKQAAGKKVIVTFHEIPDSLSGKHKTDGDSDVLRMARRWI